MFNLIGFWGNVTFLTVILLSPIFIWFVPPLVRHFVKAITQSEHKAEVVTENFFRYVSDYPFNRMYIFRKNVSEGWVIASTISGLIAWIVALFAIWIPSSNGHPWDSIHGFVAVVSEWAAPYTSEICLFVLIYFVFIFLMRRAYTTYQKIEAVVKKVNEQS